jgi:TonB family protein
MKNTSNLFLIVLFLMGCQTTNPQSRADAKRIRIALHNSKRTFGDKKAMGETMPSPPYDIYKFLYKNIRYPSAAIENDISGKVWVSFSVDYTGRIVRDSIVSGIGYGCDEEAIRIIRLLPPWIPGVQNGKTVNVRISLAINFKLIPVNE